MNDKFGTDLLTLIDEEGEHMSLEVLDVLTMTGCFMAALPTLTTRRTAAKPTAPIIFLRSLTKTAKSNCRGRGQALLDRLARRV